MKFYMLNDSFSINSRYRKNLIKKLKKISKKIDTFGWKDQFLKYLIICAKSFFLERTIISSNLKSNIISLILCKKFSVNIILNGVGRYRQNRNIRIFIFYLISKRARTIAIQNYADYRYFKKYYSSYRPPRWVCGSGGEKRNISSSNDRYFIITRDSKLPIIANSLILFTKNHVSTKTVDIIGCHRLIDSLQDNEGIKFIPRGYLEQNEIFTFGKNFIQADGYGEGFPHTLADAIVSNLNIFLTKKSYIQYGLYKLGFSYHPKCNKWIELIYDQSLSNLLEQDNISNQYLELFIKTKQI